MKTKELIIGVSLGFVVTTVFTVAFSILTDQELELPTPKFPDLEGGEGGKDDEGGKGSEGGQDVEDGQGSKGSEQSTSDDKDEGNKDTEHKKEDKLAANETEAMDNLNPHLVKRKHPDHQVSNPPPVSGEKKKEEAAELKGEMVEHSIPFEEAAIDTTDTSSGKLVEQSTREPDIPLSLDTPEVLTAKPLPEHKLAFQPASFTSEVFTISNDDFPLTTGSKGKRVERLKVWLLRNFGGAEIITDLFDLSTKFRLWRYMKLSEVTEEIYDHYKMGEHVTKQLLVR